MGMDVYGKAPTGKAGEYFRANIWSWRPIHALCETVLGRELPSWGFNDGDGLQSQAECDELANKLTAYLKAFPGERIALESDMRINPHTGEFLRRGTKEGVTAYSTTRGHVREFIRFLRACGGFEIN